MKFTLLPDVPFEGPLSSFSQSDTDVFMPPPDLLLAVEHAGGTARVGKYHIVVDIEQAAFDTLLPTLTGWTGQAVQRTSTVTAFEGMLAYHFAQKNKPEA